jgi:hypothetical protein
MSLIAPSQSESEAPLVVDRPELDRLASAPAPLTPTECAEHAERAADALDLSALDRSGTGHAVLLWRSDSSEAWLNVWWDARDTGYHDHDGSGVGVYVIDGVARNESLVIGVPRRLRVYTRGDRFSFAGSGIHRMEHEPGAIRSTCIRRRSARSATTNSRTANFGAGRRRPMTPRPPAPSCSQRPKPAATPRPDRRVQPVDL